MGSLMVLEQEHQATHGREGKGRGTTPVTPIEETPEPLRTYVPLKLARHELTAAYKQKNRETREHPQPDPRPTRCCSVLTV